MFSTRELIEELDRPPYYTEEQMTYNHQLPNTARENLDVFIRNNFLIRSGATKVLAELELVSKAKTKKKRKAYLENVTRKIKALSAVAYSSNTYSRDIHNDLYEPDKILDLVTTKQEIKRVKEQNEELKKVIAVLLINQ